MLGIIVGDPSAGSDPVAGTDIFNLIYFGFLFVAFAAGMSKGGQR
jgi:hypothetical protein